MRCGSSSMPRPAISMGALAVSAAQTWLPRTFMSLGMTKPERMPMPWKMNRCTPAVEAS